MIMDDLATAPREITLEEAVSVANALQITEQFSDAAELYRRVLEINPAHPDALHFSGVLAHHQGRGRFLIDGCTSTIRSGQKISQLKQVMQCSRNLMTGSSLVCDKPSTSTGSATGSM